MKTTLENLWYGNIPSEEMHSLNSSERKLLKKQVEIEDILKSRISEEDYKLLEKQIDVQNEYANESAKREFIEGFCIGAKMIIEVMQE